MTAVDSQAIVEKIAPDGKDHRGDPRGPVLSAEVVTGKQIVLKGPADSTGLKGLGLLTVAPLTQLFMGTPEPRVTLEAEGKPVNFLLETGVTLAVLLSNPGTPSTPSPGSQVLILFSAFRLCVGRH